MNQVVLKSQADGNNWNYWAEVTNAEEDDTSETVKNFAEEYVLPYMIYHKYKISNKRVYIYLNDGSYFYMQKGGCIDFVVDVNGEKRPNEHGRDKFSFLYCPEHQSTYEFGKVIPYLQKNKTREYMLAKCKQHEYAYFCSGLLALDNWQFKDDYPYHI